MTERQRLKPAEDRQYITAGELAELLAKIPAETPLFVSGYESGLNYVTSVHPVEVELFKHGAEYYGNHAEPGGWKTDITPNASGYEIFGERVPAPRTKN